VRILISALFMFEFFIFFNTQTRGALISFLVSLLFLAIVGLFLPKLPKPVKATSAVLLLVTGWRGIGPARVANIAAGTTWLALGYAGLFLVGTEFNVLGLTALDEVVLFAAAVVQLAVGLGARRDREPVTA